MTSGAMLTIAIALNIAYVILAFAAYTHMTPENKASQTERVLALMLWWPFYDVYDDTGRRFSSWGKVVLPVCVGAYAYWMLM